MKFNTQWQNFGDVNPEIHDGQFIRYDEDKECWVHIKTYCLEERGIKTIDIDCVFFVERINEEADWWFEIEYIYPDDIFVDEHDLSKGFVPEFQEFVDGEMQSYHSPSLELLISEYVTFYTYLDPLVVESKDYWNDLSEYGITPDVA